MRSEAFFMAKHICLGAKNRPFTSQEMAVCKAKNNHLRVVLSKTNCTLFIIYKHNADRLHITFAHDSSHIYATKILNFKRNAF